jgi:tRNA pseudouridine38-40 synthase
MRTVRAELAYDGSKFYGWQRQDGFRSVQEAVEEALMGLLGEVVCVHGAGRTDTGVHALRQVAHFQVQTRLEDDQLRHAINAHLDRSVVVTRLESCRDDFHARFDARAKRYVYLVRTARFRPPHGREYAHWVSQPLDLGAMRQAARAFLGSHDFHAFGNTGSERKTTVRSIEHSRIVARRDWFAYVVQGDGFLYNMVRTMAGTLLDVGRGKRAPEAIDRALASGERDDAGPTAPAQGLYLARVLYSEPTFLGRDRGPRGVPGLYQY